jgi:hypothetical protein
MFGHDVPQLLDQRQLAILRVVVGIEEEIREVHLLGQGSQYRAFTPLHVEPERLAQSQFPLERKSRRPRQGIEPCQ